MQASVNHVGIFTDRPRATKNFYRKMGFRSVAKAFLNADFIEQLFGIRKGCFFEKLTFRDTFLEIFYADNLHLRIPHKNSAGINHWALQVENRESYIRILKRKNIKIIRLSRNDRFVYFVKDPNGVLIEIRE